MVMMIIQPHNLLLCRTVEVRPVPGSSLTCLKVVADRKLAPKLDLVETDGAVHGCQVGYAGFKPPCSSCCLRRSSCCYERSVAESLLCVLDK